MSRAEVRKAVREGRFRVVAEAVVDHRRIMKLENDTILVDVNGIRAAVVKPELREVAKPLGVALSNGAGGLKNTRQLGADILTALLGPSASR